MALRLPWLAAARYHLRASAGLAVTPWPRSYRVPRLYSATGWPCSAAFSNHWKAATESPASRFLRPMMVSATSLTPLAAASTLAGGGAVAARGGGAVVGVRGMAGGAVIWGGAICR